jgi:ABC-type glutathione transport system ATPase component
MTLLRVERLSVGFGPGSGRPDILRDLSFGLDSGGCLGLVGESGAGKTLTSLALAGLLPAPLRVTGGRILLDDSPLPLSPDDWRRRRGRDVLVLFQSPLAALDPAAAVRRQVADAVAAVRRVGTRAALGLADTSLARMGLTPEQCGQRPHELSGGMRQRALLAFAWALRPRILVADEPTSGLDPVRQLEILDLLRTTAAEEGVAVILISHDLRVIAQIAQSVIVLEQGRLAEQATVPDLLLRPRSDAGRRLAAAFRRFAGTCHE